MRAGARITTAEPPATAKETRDGCIQANILISIGEGLSRPSATETRSAPSTRRPPTTSTAELHSGLLREPSPPDGYATRHDCCPAQGLVKENSVACYREVPVGTHPLLPIAASP